MWPSRPSWFQERFSRKKVFVVIQVRKFLVALGAALGVLATALHDSQVTASEWVGVAIAFLGALGVYQVPNKSKDVA